MLTERSARIREARKLTRRPGREKAGRFLAEGPQAVREALAEATGSRPGLVVELFAGETAAARHADLVGTALDLDVPVSHATDAAMAALSDTVTPQGLVAVCRSLTVPAVGALAGARLVALLAEVRDPGNVGTVIRCADAAGADAVVLTTGSVDPHSGKAVRASAGSLFHLPVAADISPDEAVETARAAGLTVLAADGTAEIDLVDAGRAGLLERPTAWLFGNEAWGLPEGLCQRADETVRVPIYGRAESLNLATAAAVCLYASATAMIGSTGHLARPPDAEP
jgi:RNA methyltransferase, TrmH family